MLNKCPISDVNPIATVPQNVMRKMAFFMFEPPAFAAIAPRSVRNTIAKIYCKISILGIDAKIATKKGKSPPTSNDAQKRKLLEVV